MVRPILANVAIQRPSGTLDKNTIAFVLSSSAIACNAFEHSGSERIEVSRADVREAARGTSNCAPSAYRGGPLEEMPVVVAATWPVDTVEVLAPACQQMPSSTGLACADGVFR